MGAGCAFDVAFALAILVARRPAASLLGLAVPEDPIYLGLAGVLLLLLGGFYALAAVSPERYQGIPAVAAGGRVLGSAYFAVSWLQGRPAAFLWLAAADLALGVTHAATLILARREAANRS
jgi:hypothetical protein